MPARWGIPLLTALDATTGAILVAESGRSASGAPCATSLPWGAEAVAAWRLARRTLPHALPLVWGRLSEVAQPSVCVLGFDEGGRPSSVDGSSLGLAFALLLGTEALGLRLPPDLAVTGALTVTGEVVAVGGLEPKINSLTAFAPGIRRLLVPKAQVTDAARIHAPHLQIIGVATVAEAVSTAFGGDLAAALVRAGETAEARAELAESFFELALDRHHAVPTWAPSRRPTRPIGPPRFARRWPSARLCRPSKRWVMSPSSKWALVRR